MALCLKPEATPCCCPSMTGPSNSCPPPQPPAPNPKNKYFHEVGAEMIGNQLIILLEKDKSRKKKRANWEPPCDCDVIEIKRPTSKRGPKIVNAGDNNQILFKVHSKAHLNRKEDPNYKPQAIAYKINRSGPESERCRKITIYPQLGGPISQDVYTDHISEDDHDVYLLRVKKKNDASVSGKKRNLEVELRTPKPVPMRVSPAKEVLPPALAPEEKAREEAKKGSKGKKKK